MNIVPVTPPSTKQLQSKYKRSQTFSILKKDRMFLVVAIEGKQRNIHFQQGSANAENRLNTIQRAAHT
jgi:hypothetical protein